MEPRGCSPGGRPVSEIAALESEKERGDFMREAGIAEPAVNLLSRLCMRALGLISFFTVGDDEVRQWLIRTGSSAPEAAGAIHTDMQRGFIRAEVMKYPDLSGLKSEDAVKKAGRFHVMGREYIVEDGDIIEIGEEKLQVLHTPGHTPGGICLLCGNDLITGDTLFVGGVGRTDFPGGSHQDLMDSIKSRLLVLPDDTVVWPGHGYGGKHRRLPPPRAHRPPERGAADLRGRPGRPGG